MIQEDEKSMGYAQYQFKKFKESVGKIKPLAEEECQKLRMNAKDDLAVVKGQYKRGMVENKAENSSEKTLMALRPMKISFSLILSSGGQHCYFNINHRYNRRIIKKGDNLDDFFDPIPNSV